MGKSQGKVKAEMKKICLLTILGLFVIAEAKPQNNQGNNIQWNEERQERPPAQQNTVQWTSASYGSTSNTNWRPRPRECLNGHLHVLTGHGYGQNQRFDYETETSTFGLNVIAAFAHSGSYWGGGCCWEICGGNHGWCYRIYPNQFRYIYVRNVSNIRIVDCY